MPEAQHPINVIGKIAMNILFLFAQYPKDENGSNLHKDLPDEFCRQGANVFVATIQERRLGLKTSVSQENGRHVLRVRTGNMFNDTSKFEKVVVMLSMSGAIYSQIKKHWGDVKFDLIVGSTPYTANEKLIKGLKAHFECPAFLILWDLFPQNARDLGLIKNRLLFKFFKNKEIRNYDQFDHIGCMSDGNLRYVADNYPSVDEKKLSIFPLWGTQNQGEKETSISRTELGFHDEDFVCVFGGNMGMPQNLSNVMRLANEVKEFSKIKFLLIGDGVEANKVKSLSLELQLSNVVFLKHLERSVYETVMVACNVGLVSLSPKFTVPNFPSKTMDYLKYNLPILASVDDTALADYGYFIEKKAKVGLCCDADDMGAYKRNLLALYRDKKLYGTLASNCKNAYEEYFDIKANYEIITRCIS
jgi:glycosyltransferase involved in cell wall biosynthesis